MEQLVRVCLLLQVYGVFGQVPFYHTKSFTYIYPSEDVPKDGYFGYSSAYDYMSERLIVSAPNADAVGQVFYCELDGSKCEKISDVLFESMKNDSIAIKENYKLLNHKFWLGATVRTQPQLIMICAPRYATRNLHHGLLFSKYGTKGRCLWKNRNDWQILQYPATAIGDVNREFEKLMSSLGWSVDITKSVKLVGGPSMGIDKRGLVTVFRNNLNTAPYFLLENEDLLKENKINANFGYSVVVGSFFDRKGYFAVSTTYGEKGIGKVFIFKSDNTLHSIVSQPDSLGIMYGAALCAAKLRGGYRDDLLVGAPAYAKSTEQYDSGAVYIYSKQDNKYFMDLRLNLTGQHTGGYFGSSIINLGDVDHDGSEDLAIAAPYENEGRGSVYIYSGYDLKNSKTKPLQQLQAESKSFGLSLATMPDHDKNGCKELIIGAPSPNAEGRSMVVMANCFPIITTDVKVDCKIKETVSDAILFQVKSCVNVKYPRHIKDIKANIEMNVKVKHSEAKLLKNKTSNDLNDTTSEVTYNKTLDTTLQHYCEEDIVVLPDVANHNLEIIVNVTAKLVNSPADQETFDKSQALLSARSHLHDKCLIFHNYCNKTECKPDLQLQVHPGWNPEEHYLVGSSERETFSMLVKNVGDVAYAACVRVEARGVGVVGLPYDTSRCDYDRADHTSNSFICHPNVHIDTGDTWDVGDITLDTKTLSSENSNFSIVVYVYNNHANNVSSPPHVTLTKLKYDYENVHVDGKSEEGTEVIVTKSDVENRKQLQHLYDIQNNGVTHFKHLTGIVTVKTSPYYVMPKSSVKVITDSASYEECVLNTESDDVYTASCDLGDLSPGDMKGVIAFIEMREFESNERKNKLVFYSDFILLYNDETTSINRNVSTIIKFQVALEVSWWVILVAIILGILVVILIVFLLFEAGCLRRRNKEKLQDLKKEVRRQSVRRSMRLRNSGGSATDGTQLIEHSEPESNECVNELYQSADAVHNAQVHSEPNNRSRC